MPRVTAPLPDLVLYRRRECALCDEARTNIQLVLEDRAIRSLPIPLVREVDIDADADLEPDFGARIPVIELGDRRLELAVSAARLRRLLAEELDARRTV